MAQQVKAPANKSNSLNFISRAHMVEGETGLFELSTTSTHTSLIKKKIKTFKNIFNEEDEDGNHSLGTLERTTELRGAEEEGGTGRLDGAIRADWWSSWKTVHVTYGARSLVQTVS